MTRGPLTSEIKIQVIWQPLTGNSTGGASISSYYLQWDLGTNGINWYDIVGYTDPYLLLNFTVTSNIHAG